LVGIGLLGGSSGFRRGKLQKPYGSLLYTFRRAWATERKHLPPNDVAAAGGWLDTGTRQ